MLLLDLPLATMIVLKFKWIPDPFTPGVSTRFATSDNDSVKIQMDPRPFQVARLTRGVNTTLESVQLYKTLGNV